MSNPRPEYGPVNVVAEYKNAAQLRLSLSIAQILTTYPYFKFDILDAGGPLCHFIPSVLRAGRFTCSH